MRTNKPNTLPSEYNKLCTVDGNGQHSGDSTRRNSGLRQIKAHVRVVMTHKRMMGEKGSSLFDVGRSAG